MEITLNIKSTDVKRLVNLIISMCFIIFGIICCYIMTYYSTEINNVMDILTEIISTFFFTILALAAVFINFAFFLRKDDSDFGYYMASGFGIGAGIAVECCALLAYPLATIFFWAFAVVPIVVFAVNTTIWTLVCKNSNENEQTNIVHNKRTLPFTLSFITCIAVCIALLVYFIIAGSRFEDYFLIPVVIIAPIFISAIIGFTVSTVKKTQQPWMWLIIGLCFGLSWIFAFRIFLDYSIFPIGVSFTAFVLGFLGLSIWLTHTVIKCFSIIKANKKTTDAVNNETTCR